MKLQSQDILLQIDSKGESLWVSERLLVEVCSMSVEYLWKIRSKYKKSVRQCDLKRCKLLPDTGKSWRWMRANKTFYYCWDNIPDRSPKYYRSKMGTETSLKEALKGLESEKKDSVKTKIQAELEAMTEIKYRAEDIRYYMYSSEVLFPERRADQMARAVAILEMIRYFLNENKYKNLHNGIKKQDFMEYCAEWVQSQELEGMKVSSSVYLLRKIEKAPEDRMEVRDYLVSSKYKNNNAKIVGKHRVYDKDTGEVFSFGIHQALIYTAYMAPGQNTKESMSQQYRNYYLPAIEEWGEEPVSLTAYRSHLKRANMQVKLLRQRHGKDYWRKSSLTYIPSKKLEYAHSLFCGDGSGTVRYKWVDKDGKLRVRKLYVMLVSDVHSSKIVGYSFARLGQSEEDYGMLESATKMAIETSGRQTMFEFISDNHGAFSSEKSNAFLSKVYNVVRRIAAGNSQANPAETQFRLFKQSLRNLPNFGDTSWGAGIDSQANPDYLRAEDLPSYDEAKLQFEQIVQKWNSTPRRDGVTPNERFENKHPNIAPMDERMLRWIYGNHTQVNTAYMRGFVQVSKTKGYDKVSKYIYEIPDYADTGVETIAEATGYQKNTHVKVVWDEQAADLYNIEGAFIMTCLPTAKTSTSHAEADEVSLSAYEHHRRRKKKQGEVVDEFERELKNMTDMMGYSEHMKYGGSKQSYNEQMEEAEEHKTIEQIKRERIERDFNNLKNRQHATK